MAFEYILNYSCPAKEKFPVQELFLLVKQKNQTEAIISMIRKDGDSTPFSEIMITQQVQTQEGVSNEEISLQELINQTNRLEDIRDICTKCRANIHKNPFGCYGAIHYPIQQETEEWLMALLPDDLSTLAGVYIQKAVKDFNYDGKPIQEMRNSNALFESRKSQAIKWGRLERRPIIPFPEYRP